MKGQGWYICWYVGFHGHVIEGQLFIIRGERMLNSLVLGEGKGRLAVIFLFKGSGIIRNKNSLL